MAGELLMTISKDERERAVLRSRRMFQADRESDMLTMKSVGRAEGLAEGLAEGILKVARNAIRNEMSIDSIMVITGLTREEIERIRDAN